MRPDLAEFADRVSDQLQDKPFVPDIELRKGEWWRPPHESHADKERWWAMFFDMLGTRQTAVVDMFFDTLSKLVGSTYDKSTNGWVPNRDELRAIFGMIQAMRPRNSAEAALAAQLVALHLNQLRLAAGIANWSGSDGRTVAIMARVTRAYADGLLTLQRLKGRARKSEQVIRVETHKHVHHHQHIQVGGGEPNFGGQPQGTEGGEAVECTALPGPDEARAALPIAGCEGKKRVPNARRGKGKRSARRGR